MNSFANPAVILCDLETISRRLSLKASNSERKIIAKELGAVENSVNYGSCVKYEHQIKLTSYLEHLT